MISPELFLTASHCVQQDITTDTVSFNYEYLSDRKTLQPEERYRILQMVEDGYTEQLDYAVLRLENSPGLKYGYTPLSSRVPSFNENLVIIQHPLGRPKQYASGYFNSSEDNYYKYHYLDTLSGSSGAGVLDPEGRLIAVHTDGGCENGMELNKGTSIAAIIKSSVMLQRLLK